MPTLLQINSSANASSHGKIAEAVGWLAIKQGWRSVIAYGRRMNPSKSELIHVGTSYDLREHGVESRLLDNQGLASRNATKKFLRQVEDIKPDVIQLHNIHGYYLNYKLLFEYLNSTNIPIIWTLHDCWSFTGHCAHFVTAGCEKWKTGCYGCPLKGDYPKSFVDRSKRNYELKKKLFTANPNLHIVTVSDWLAGLVKQSYFHDKEVRIIKNGVDLDVFKPMPFEKTNKYRILGVSGVWTKEKGLYDIFRLREMIDVDKYEIILVGLNKKQIDELPKGVTGLERTESIGELAMLYSSANALINLTYADSFPTVNLEALACGTPIVTYRTGGSPEAIDEKTGIVVEQGDVSAIANAVAKMCSLNREQLKNDCRARAEKGFNRNDRFEDYMNLYNEVLK